MGNNTKVVAIFGVLVFLQAVSCAVARHHADQLTPLTGVQSGTMTLDGYEEGEEGGGPAACDGIYHSDGDFLLTLPTELYAGGALCHRFMNIASTETGRSARAMVVDLCDDCGDDELGTSAAVWIALGLHTDAGVAPITWSVQ
ncbi:putative ripening-related protein 7 [Hordeum vulgare]|nr:putative ripening-related protein 7 [Hordeum vulgare]